MEVHLCVGHNGEIHKLVLKNIVLGLDDLLIAFERNGVTLVIWERVVETDERMNVRLFFHRSSFESTISLIKHFERTLLSLHSESAEIERVLLQLDILNRSSGEDHVVVLRENKFLHFMIDLLNLGIDLLHHSF